MRYCSLLLLYCPLAMWIIFKKVTNQFRTTLKCYLLKEVSYERWAPMRDPKYRCDLTEERKFLIMCQVVAYTVYMHVCVLARPGLWLLLTAVHERVSVALTCSKLTNLASWYLSHEIKVVHYRHLNVQTDLVKEKKPTCMTSPIWNFIGVTEWLGDRSGHNIFSALN